MCQAVRRVVRERHGEARLEGGKSLSSSSDKARGLEPRTVTAPTFTRRSRTPTTIPKRWARHRTLRGRHRTRVGVGDGSILRYTREHDRLALVRDDSFFAGLDAEDTAGALFRRDRTLSAREVEGAVHETSRYPDHPGVTLEDAGESWCKEGRRRVVHG